MRDAANDEPHWPARDPYMERAGVWAAYSRTTALVQVDAFGPVFNGAVDLDEENGRGVDGIARGIDGRLDRDDRRLIHHFKRSRKDARGDNGRNRLRGGVHRREIGEDRADGLGVPRELCHL